MAISTLLPPNTTFLSDVVLLYETVTINPQRTEHPEQSCSPKVKWLIVTRRLGVLQLILHLEVMLDLAGAAVRKSSGWETSAADPLQMLH